ncbi:MAG: ATP-grasp fold amidoligase family protein [Segetibacter sp.]
MAEDIKSELRDCIDAWKGRPVKGHGKFSKRIKNRHRTFWKSSDAEIIRNTVMNASDLLDKWKDVKNWQRKLSNKNNAREFAKKHGCRVPEIYWRGRDIDNINFNNLPSQFVLKPTIGCSSKLVFLMNDKFNFMNNLSYSKKELTKIMAEALKENYYLEFIIEEFVRSEQGKYKIPNDYKFHTFKGEIAAINVINRFANKEGFMRAYDANWNLIKEIGTDFPKGPYQDPPACLEEMIAHAKVLSKAYEIYVRIDFYATDKGAVFGEFTPTPSLGNYYTHQADQLLANYWDKYCNGMV